MAVDRGNQRSLLTADKGAGAKAQLNVEIKAGTQDIFAQQAIFAGLANGHLEAVYGDRIFSADVDISLIGADGIAGNRHGLQHRVGVALQHRAVHERARIALIRVTGHIFLVGLALVSHLPL